MLRLSIITLTFLIAANLQSEELYFPYVKAKTLNKDSFFIPDSLNTEFNIFIISFNRGMQGEVENWLIDLELLNNQKSSFDVFNSPVIPDPGRFVRGFINRGFKSIYKEKSVRDKVIIMYVDEDNFFSTLNINDSLKEKPLIMVLNRNAKVIYQINGISNPDRIKELEYFINSYN
jgi:hypothetical protein